ncbi:MAG: hypothetical protein ACLU8W_05305 [Clostridia bacterium]
MPHYGFSAELTTARILFALSFVNILNHAEIDDDSCIALMQLFFEFDGYLKGLSDALDVEF